MTLTKDQNGFVFETEEMVGRIETDDAYHGVWQLHDKQTGREWIHPKYSALNLFRLFATHQGMGQPRHMPRTVTSNANSVTIHWDATQAHLGTIDARYTLTSPTTIDLNVTVKLSGTYAGYELFMSNYFAPILRPFVYLKTNRYGKSTDGQDVVPEQEINAHVQMALVNLNPEYDVPLAAYETFRKDL